MAIFRLQESHYAQASTVDYCKAMFQFLAFLKAQDYGSRSGTLHPRLQLLYALGVNIR